MRKVSSFVLMSGLILGGMGSVLGQKVLPSDSRPESAPEEVSSEAKELQIKMYAEHTRTIREFSPGLYAFQTRLNKIKKEIEIIEKHFAKKEIDQEQAKNELVPLVREEREIENDPDYLAEQKLLQVYLSSPEYRAKVEKTMRTLRPKQPAGQR